MTVRPIRIVGDPVLHTPTRLVTEFGTVLGALVHDMFDTMAAAQGVGLAANQIGVDLRLFVYDCPDEDGARHRGVVINPV
ncbi:MAG: peptide deformylase, partial [Pseudonocardiaceae bacterium]